MELRKCKTCQSPIVPSDGPGRPKEYCGAYCQSKAREKRKLVRQMQGAVDRSNAKIDLWLRECGV